MTGRQGHAEKQRLAIALAVAATLGLGGCGSTPSGRHAPIVDHSLAANGTPVAGGGYAGGSYSGGARGPTVARAATAPPTARRGQSLPPVYVDDSNTLVKDWRPRTYTVQPGDTLYGIAFNFGLDYRDIAALNNITDPTVIHAGQVLRLFPAGGATRASVAAPPAAPAIVTQPVVVKLPYSAQAVAQIDKQQAVPIAPAAVAPVAARPAAGAARGVYVNAGVAPGNVGVKWEMPASGRVIARFSEADNKGIDIAGKLGQPVYASAPGKVVYAGSGLRGYGKLVIIKHNAVYLSAYAHNYKLLVKEGQMVSQGQMIAQMGSSDANRVALHFEIRKLGRPVDPAKYLVLPKS
jgi:lipoprotein NlpD